MNSTNFVGRLTKDPELKYTPAGKAVATFTLAVNRSFKSEGQPTADFIRVKVWNKPAENAQKYLKRGSLISIQARVETGSYDQDGKKVYTTEFVANEITYLEKAPGSNQSNGPTTSNQQPNQQNQNNQSRVSDDPFTSGSGPIEVSDDDLPF